LSKLKKMKKMKKNCQDFVKEWLKIGPKFCQEYNHNSSEIVLKMQFWSNICKKLIKKKLIKIFVKKLSKNQNWSKTGKKLAQICQKYVNNMSEIGLEIHQKNLTFLYSNFAKNWSNIVPKLIKQKIGQKKDQNF
jgi:hypothetical protein